MVVVLLVVSIRPGSSSWSSRGSSSSGLRYCSSTRSSGLGHCISINSSGVVCPNSGTRRSGPGYISSASGCGSSTSSRGPNRRRCTSTNNDGSRARNCDPGRRSIICCDIFSFLQ